MYIDWNTGINSYKDMQLMSYCKHNIIANSTFTGRTVIDLNCRFGVTIDYKNLVNEYLKLK